MNATSAVRPHSHMHVATDLDQPQRLRIALVGPYRYPVREPFAGGLESHVSELATGLTDRGHDVSVFARDGSTGVRPGDELEPGWAPSSAATSDVSMPELDVMLEHHAYQRIMLRLIHGEGRERFDVVHLQTVHHLPAALAALVPVPVLATLHTPPTAWMESALTVTGGSGARFTAVSEHVSRSWTVLPQRPDVVLNGVDTSVWRRGRGGGDLVWSGRLVPEKAPHLAVLAARAAGRRLVIAGPVSDPDYVQRHLVPLLADDVSYAGHLGRRDLARLVGGAAVLLATPDWDEPFGLVVAEALSCGTPVVAFDRGGVREVVGRSGVLVPAGDVAAMARAIPAAEAIDRTTVRRDAATRLSIDRMVDQYVAHYRQLVAFGRPDPFGRVHDDPASRGGLPGYQAQTHERVQPPLHREPAPLLAKVVGITDD